MALGSEGHLHSLHHSSCVYTLGPHHHLHGLSGVASFAQRRASRTRGRRVCGGAEGREWGQDAVGGDGRRDGEDGRGDYEGSDVGD